MTQNLLNDDAAPVPVYPRYYITDELWETFTFESVNKTITALREYGAELHHPENFTVRVSAKALWSTDDSLETLRDQYEEETGLSFGNPEEWTTSDQQTFYDFHQYGFANGTVNGKYSTVTQLARYHFPNCPLAQRAAVLRGIVTGIYKEDQARKCPETVILRQWWEKDWACTEVSKPAIFKTWQPFTVLAACVLIICLYERTVRRVLVEPRRPPKTAIGKKLAARRGQFYDPAPETTLYVPARKYSEHKGTHASPRLHYRHPHVRQQPYGSRSAPTYKAVWIEGQFINAIDCTEAEKAEVKIRPQNFKLRS